MNQQFFQLNYLNTTNRKISLGNVLSGILGLVAAEQATQQKSPYLLLAPDNTTALQLFTEIKYFLENTGIPVLYFSDRETLPYDVFSPNQEIISERLAVLNVLPYLSHGIVIASIATCLHKLSPPQFLSGTHFDITCGDKIDIPSFQKRLALTGYKYVEQVYLPGEFALRGSIIDLFPMGSKQPFRLDLFDDEVDSIRTFDTETQRTIEKIDAIKLLPGNEYPLTEDSIKHFRHQWRARFPGNPLESPIYQDISNGMASPGIEYYLPLFFETMSDISGYLPENTIILKAFDLGSAARSFTEETLNRYEQKRVDSTRPLLSPHELFLDENALNTLLKDYQKIKFTPDLAPEFNLICEALPNLAIDRRAQTPLHKLAQFVSQSPYKTALIVESTGRREALLELLKNTLLRPQTFLHWHDFIAADVALGLMVAPQSYGFILSQQNLAVVTETELFGEHAVLQRRRDKHKWTDPDTIIKDLSELQIGTPVVHLEHGIGRYLGLQLLTVDEPGEFLILEYAGGDKLYVPVTSLHLISRYTGAASEHTVLNKLGTDTWQKVKKKAAEKIRDVAAELLKLYAARAAKKGFVFKKPDQDYYNFASSFPFELTLDQEKAIEKIIADMTSTKSMDRLICGDVGFGKTEVAMRAAYLAVQSGKQVAVLVPTTLLAEQHYQNFSDRFADWPIEIAALSRFKSTKETQTILENLQNGKVDIVIGTHKLIQKNVRFHTLGLLIIDEEHRFGVTQKDQIKRFREEVDMLTLTATPIPRTLNMSMSGIRDLSIIATPPAKRLAIKTFVKERNNSLIREAILREIMRGGQVYFLYNKVETIEAEAQKLQKLLPEIRLAVAHGQMPERQLERIMSDFYHHRYNVLLCTTIIESGIDVPTANTMIIDHADKFGLAQLHQLRGRVGRSHHQAYAYLLINSEESISNDAKKRLEVIASFEDLGAGFILATHDLEIRGAGELLGEEQSGHIEAIGFNLYMELLDRAVRALKSGKSLDLETSIESNVTLELKIPAYIPDFYLPDIHTRLILYKRIANALTENDLKELQIEMIDRFGLLSQPAKNLFAIAELKLKVEKLGIKHIEADSAGGVINFFAKPEIDPGKIIQLIQQKPQQFKLGGQDRLRFYFEEKISGKVLISEVENIITELARKNSK